MGDIGGGIRFYPYRNFFVRPEVRLYLINKNLEFTCSLQRLDWLHVRREQVERAQMRNGDAGDTSEVIARKPKANVLIGGRIVCVEINSPGTVLLPLPMTFATC
jgi:hypothetical protein